MTVTRIALCGVLLMPLHAVQAGPLDDALRATAPCSALPGFDRTDQLRLNSVDLSVRRDVISFRAEGDVACTATGSTLLRGNLTARVRLETELDSTTCRTKATSVELANLGGTAGAILAGQRTDAEKLLSEGFRLFAERECRKSLGPFLDN